MRGYGSCACFVMLVALSAAGCEGVANYSRNRGRDVLDVLGIEGYCGQGIVVNGRMTKLAQVGVVAFDGDVARCDDRACGVSEEMRAEFGVPLYHFAAYDRKVVTECSSQSYIDAYSASPTDGQAKYSLTDTNDRSFYEVGISLAVFVGGGVHVDLLQVVDLFAGLFGLDPGRDDEPGRGLSPVRDPRYEGTQSTPVSSP